MEIGRNYSTSSRLSLELNRTGRALTRALERLSSGKRVNSAQDGAADFATVVRLQAQVRGLTQGTRNINQALSAIEVADSAISSQLDLVQRMREIAVQASNSTLSDGDRDNLNVALQSLLEEYRRIVSDTEFNGSKLIDGSFGTQAVGFGEMEFNLGSTDSTEVFERIYGRGVASSSQTLGTSASTDSVTVADFNGDGFDDFLGFDNSGVGSVFVGSASGAFSLESTFYANFSGIRTPGVGDLDNDGDLDLALSDSSSTSRLFVFKNEGTGAFNFAGCMSFGANPVGAGSVSFTQLADFNEDGNLDVVGGDEPGYLNIAMGNGDGTFKASTQIYTGGALSDRSIADINSDGHLDLVYSIGVSVIAKLGNGLGGFSTTNTFAVGGSAVDVELGDFNEDGILDFATISNSGTLSTYQGVGDGNFINRQTLTWAATTNADLTIGDFNNDDHLDLAVNSSTTAIGFYYGTGSGGFSALSTMSVNYIGNNLAVTDLNRDGVLDFISGRSGSWWGITQATGYRNAVTDVRVSTQAEAETLISILDNAVANLVGEQSELAAIHSRLDSSASSALLLSESLEEARSRVEDADIAEETAELVKSQILQQAQVAVLSQANLQMNTVLQLLNDL